MATEDEKLTVIKMVVVNAFEPDFILSLNKLSPEYRIDSAIYCGRTLSTKQIWDSIQAVKSALSLGKTARHKRLFAQSQSIAPSSVVKIMDEFGIKYKNNAKKPEPLSNKIVGSVIFVSVSAFLIFLIVGVFAFFSEYDGRVENEDVWRYKACKHAGDWGDRWDCEKRLGGH